MADVEEGQTGNPPQASAVGNIVDFKEGEVLLPSYVERRPSGLFVDPEAAAREGGITQFIERVFSAGARFAGLDYAVFQNLLYDLTGRAPGPVRLADDIVFFAPERRALYRAVKIADDKTFAEYLFEPVEIEVEERVPLFGPPAEDGSVEVVGEEIRKRGEPTRLDFDEFVAAMWEKGVRFGIDAVAVRAAIRAGQPQRLEIAHAVQPTQGRDANLEEKSDTLHRDNAPRILADGRMDLKQFKNRFPQIMADVRLLHKIPRSLGKPGHDVLGTLLESELPKDFDIAALAGPGTRVEKGADGEFIVSAMDGFINIDGKTNQISVTEKMISREGVSMKTTGDVSLSGDEFEEHGEVQERRAVEGRHMTFFADVYGSIVSRGGRVVLKSNIAGGQASSPGGSIVVEGRASRAVLEARGGEIVAAFAEGCSIVGTRVTVERAINCDILGEDVVIGVSEGSAIAGKRLKIAQSGTRKDIETIVAVLVPDMSGFVRDLAELEEARQQAEQKVAAQDVKIGNLLADTGFKQFLALAATISKGGAKLSAEHEANWRQAQSRFAPKMREWQALQQERAAVFDKLEAVLAELAALAERQAHAGDDIGCVIESVNGDTLVRRLAYQPDQSVTGGAQARDLAAHLREFGVSADRLFWGTSGEFSWRLEAKADPDAAA
ncbi:MAG: flagellar assembly protein A [Pseudomonadota bacterium]